MATKTKKTTKTKKVVKKTTKKTAVVLTAKQQKLVDEATALLKKDGTTLASFRRDLKASPDEYGKCTQGECNYCDAARLLRKADKKAA